MGLGGNGVRDATGCNLSRSREAMGFCARTISGAACLLAMKAGDKQPLLVVKSCAQEGLSPALVGDFVKAGIDFVCGIVLPLCAGNDEAHERYAFFGVLASDVDEIERYEPAGGYGT